MKNAKRIIVMFGIVLFAGVIIQPPDRIAGAEPEQLRQLKAENKALRGQVASLLTQTRELKTQLHRVKLQLAGLQAELTTLKRGPTARPATRPITASQPATTEYSYRGRKVSKAWFDAKYKEFADNITLVGGKFHDVGKAVLNQPLLWSGTVQFDAREPAPIGALRWTILADRYTGSVKVFQALPGGKAIVAYVICGMGIPASERTMFFHATETGVDKAKHIDGANISHRAWVCLGTYSYVTAAGARATIQSYGPHRPLTREEFRQALAKGFVLNHYRKAYLKGASRKSKETQIKTIPITAPR